MWATAAAKGVTRSFRLSTRIPRSLPLLVSARCLATSCTRLPPSSTLKRVSLPRARLYSTDETVSVQADTEVTQNVKRHHITTLDPSKLTREDYLDVSGFDWPFVKITSDLERSVILREGPLSPDPPAQTFGSAKVDTAPLPDRTAGFLYLKKAPAGAPETAAEIRMRITNDPDPTSFSSGTDLVRNGLPWRHPLTKCNAPWALSLMKRDEMLSETAQARFKDMTAARKSFKFGAKLKQSSAVLYSRSQPFLVDFSRRELRLGLNAVIHGQDTIRNLEYQLPQKKIRANQDEVSGSTPAKDSSEKAPRVVRHALYTGKGICRFDWTTTEDGPFYSLRLLKVVEPIRPVNPDSPELKEGSIVPRYDFITGAPKFEQQRASEQSSAAVLYAMPDIPVDSEYVN